MAKRIAHHLATLIYRSLRPRRKSCSITEQSIHRHQARYPDTLLVTLPVQLSLPPLYKYHGRLKWWSSCKTELLNIGPLFFRRNDSLEMNCLGTIHTYRHITRAVKLYNISTEQTQRARCSRLLLAKQLVMPLASGGYSKYNASQRTRLCQSCTHCQHIGLHVKNS